MLNLSSVCLLNITQTVSVNNIDEMLSTSQNTADVYWANNEIPKKYNTVVDEQSEGIIRMYHPL